KLALGCPERGHLDGIGTRRTLGGTIAIKGHDDVPPDMRYGRDAIRRRLVSLHLVRRSGDGIDTPSVSEWDAAADEHRIALDPHLDDIAKRTARSVAELCDALLQRETFLRQLAE